MLQTPLFTIVAADPKGISVRAQPLPGEFDVPPHIRQSSAYQEGLSRALARIKAGQAFEGIRRPTVGVEFSQGKFTLYCQALPYSKAVGLSAFIKNELLQGKEFPLLPMSRAPAGSTGVTTAVLSAEGHIVLSRRSLKVGVHPGAWSAGFGEGLEASDLGLPDYFAAASRCLHEEVGVPESALASLHARFRPLALVRESATNIWGVYALVDCRGLDPGVYGSKALLRNAENAPDAWENMELVAVTLAEATHWLASRECVPFAREFLDLLAEAAYLSSDGTVEENQA